MDPLVSVLLPVYNGEAFVREAIASVLEQDYTNFEFIISDNASTDGTAEIIAEFSGDKRLRVIRNETTVSRLENFVLLFNSADRKSRWLKFVGDDDLLLPGCLTEMVRVAEKHDHVGLVSSYYYDGDRLVKGSLKPGRELVSGPQLLRRILLDPEARSTVFSPVSLMYSHHVYREMGGFRLDLLHADSELAHRILNHYDLAYVYKPLTVSGYHNSSGQALSTARGNTFAEAYLIRYYHLKIYNNIKLNNFEIEKIKRDLVNDSVGFMVARLARRNFKTIFKHLRIIPITAIYYIPVSLLYFIALALKKLVRRETFRIFKNENI